MGEGPKKHCVVDDDADNIADNKCAPASPADARVVAIGVVGAQHIGDMHANGDREYPRMTVGDTYRHQRKENRSINADRHAPDDAKPDEFVNALAHWPHVESVTGQANMHTNLGKRIAGFGGLAVLV